jgi:cell division protease FtsH
MSDGTAKLIDEEIKAVVNRNYQRAENLIKDNMDILHAMKDCLMKYETIDALQIDDLMARTTVRPPAGWDDKGSSSSKPDNNTDSKQSSASEKSDTTDSATPNIQPDTSNPSGDSSAS